MAIAASFDIFDIPCAREDNHSFTRSLTRSEKIRTEPNDLRRLRQQLRVEGINKYSASIYRPVCA